MGQGVEAVQAAARAGGRPAPGQRLAGKIRQHFTSSAVLASRPLLHREEDVVIERKSRAHASDANASRRASASEDGGEFHAYKSMERGGEGNCSVLPDRPMGRLIEESIDA